MTGQRPIPGASAATERRQAQWARGRTARPLFSTVARAVVFAAIVAGCGSTAPAPALTTSSAGADGTPSPATGPSHAGPGSGPALVPAIGVELQPGTYRSSVFATPLTFSVPAGWKVFEDEVGQFGLALLANDGPCLCVWRDVRAMAASCAEQPEPGVGTTAGAIAAELARRPGILASGMSPVDVGALHGVRIDVTIDPTWPTACPFSQGRPAVPTLVGSGISRGVAWDVEAGDSQRLYLLDLPGGVGNLAIMVDACCGVDRDQRVAAAAPVISSFSFAP
jgi:hypothetical protein